MQSTGYSTQQSLQGQQQQPFMGQQQQPFMGQQQQTGWGQPQQGMQQTGAPFMLRIVEARGLKKTDLTGKCDPYCIIKFKKGLLGNIIHHDAKLMTRVVERNLNPIWNEEFVLHPSKPDLDIIQIQVYDKDRIGADSLLGQVNLPVAQYWKRGLIDEWIPLQSKKKMPKPAFGELHILVKYDDTTGTGFGAPQQGMGWQQSSQAGQQYGTGMGQQYGTGWSGQQYGTGLAGYATGLGGQHYGSSTSSYGVPTTSSYISSPSGLGSREYIGSREYSSFGQPSGISYGAPLSSNIGTGSGTSFVSSMLPSSYGQSAWSQPSSFGQFASSGISQPSGGFGGASSFVNYPPPVARHQDKW